MAGLQDFIYALEMGDLRRWVLRVAVLSLLGFLGLFYFARQFNGLSNPSAMDQAQVARHIAQGKGFTTGVIRPFVLKELKERNNLAEPPDMHRMPELVHAPLHPHVLAAVFRITGVDFNVDLTRLRDFTLYAPERWIIFTNMFFLVSAVVIFYIWMVRAFDDRVAILACVLLVASDLLWNLTISGLPVPLLLLLLCLGGFFVNEALLADEAESYTAAAVWWALAGLAAGLMALTRYPFFVLFIPLAVFGFLAFFRRGLMGAIGLLVPLLMVVPWLIRNITLAGHPFGFAWVEIFADHPTMPGNTLWRIFSEDPARTLGLQPLIRAEALGLANLTVNFSACFGGIILPALFLSGLLHVFRRNHCQWSRWFWLASLLLVAVMNAALIKLRPVEQFPHLNLMVVFLPVLAGFGAAFLVVLIGRLQLPSPVLALPIFVLVCLVQAGPLGVRILQREPPPFAYPPYLPQIFFWTGSWLDEKEIQATDVPWAGAWYGQRTSIWLPHRRKDFFELNDFTVRISSLLLTPYSAQGRLYEDINYGEYQDWSGLIRRADFKDLPLPQVTVLPPNKDDFIYFSDRVRWR